MAERSQGRKSEGGRLEGVLRITGIWPIIAKQGKVSLPSKLTIEAIAHCTATELALTTLPLWIQSPVDESCPKQSGKLAARVWLALMYGARATESDSGVLGPWSTTGTISSRWLPPFNLSFFLYEPGASGAGGTTQSKEEHLLLCAPGFCSQHPHGGSWPSVITVSRGSNTSSYLHRLLHEQGTYAHMYTDTQHNKYLKWEQ